MCMCLQSGIVISDFKIKILYEFIIIPLHTTRPANQLLLDFITIIMADGEYKLWSSSLRNSISKQVATDKLYLVIPDSP